MKVYHCNHVQVYSPVVLNTSMLLCNHNHHPSPELVSPCKTESSYPLNSNSLFPHPCQPLVILLGSKNSTALSTSCQWNHTVFVFCGWFTSLGLMSLRFVHVEHMSEFPSFLRLNHNILYVFTTFCFFSIHPMIDNTWIVSSSYILCVCWLGKSKIES